MTCICHKDALALLPQSLNELVCCLLLRAYCDSKCLAAKNNMDLGLDIADDLAKVELTSVLKKRHLKIR